MKFISPNKFVKNCLLAYKEGKLDSIDPIFRRLAIESTVKSITEIYNNIPALKFFLRWIKPFHDEFIISWSPDKFEKTGIYILTNHRFIYQDKDSLKVIRNEDIKSVSVKRGPNMAKVMFQLKNGKEKIIEMAIAPNQAIWDLIIKINNSTPTDLS